MAVVTWRKDFTLISPLGSLTIPFVMLDASRCQAGTNLRITTDPVPSADGAVFHQRFKSGYQMTLGLNLYGDGVVLLGSDLQDFYDELMSHMDALLDGDGQISWPVDGGADRMLNDIRTLAMPAISSSPGVPTRQVVLGFESPFPYAIDAAETDTSLVDSTPVTITRGGSAKEFYPVAEVAGPFSTFALSNNTTGLAVSYDASRPGASSVASGHHAEVDFFKKTVTLDGDVAFLEAGVVWENADFWPLVPGANAVELVSSGAGGGTLKWQDAWA